MTLYQHKHTKKIYRITRTVSDGVYLLPDFYGSHPPRGSSRFTTYEHLKEKFEPLNKRMTLNTQTHKQENTQMTFKFIDAAHADGNFPVSVSADMNYMHAHYGVHTAMKKLTKEQLQEFLKFRFRFLQEELNEGNKAIAESHAEEVVDSLIDLVVVAVGTLDLLDVDFDRAWNEVLKANMNKEVGIKASRPNPLGLPDLIKPEGWVGPNHDGNHGTLTSIFAS